MIKIDINWHSVFINTTLSQAIADKETHFENYREIELGCYDPNDPSDMEYIERQREVFYNELESAEEYTSDDMLIVYRS